MTCRSAVVKPWLISLLVPLLHLWSLTSLLATETENLGLRLLPAAQPPAVDGTFNGWDLSGGIFACGDVENQRTNYATWMFAMYDGQLRRRALRLRRAISVCRLAHSKERMSRCCFVKSPSKSTTHFQFGCRQRICGRQRRRARTCTNRRYQT